MNPREFLDVKAGPAGKGDAPGGTCYVCELSASFGAAGDIQGVYDVASNDTISVTIFVGRYPLAPRSRNVFRNEQDTMAA
jgi:hypothetical protein